MPLRPTPATGGGGGDIKPNPSTASRQPLPKQIEIVEISDDEDDQPQHGHAQPSAQVALVKKGRKSGTRGKQEKQITTLHTQDKVPGDDDDDDDGFELVYAAGPASAQILAGKDSSSESVARHRLESSIRLKEKGKQRTVEEDAESPSKRIKESPVGTRSGYRRVERPVARFERYPARSAAISPAESVWHWPPANTSTSPPAPIPERAWQLPTPPSTTPPAANQFELNLGSIAPPKAPGARTYPADNIWVEPGFSLDLLLFSVSEIPSFERHTWLSLGSHRFLVESRHFPHTPQDQAFWAAEIKTQLLQLFGQKEWGQGEEPEVFFVVMDHLDPKKEFVNVKLFNSRHHTLARQPPSVALRMKEDCLKHFIPAAFVDPKDWLVLQFAHPTILLEPNQPGNPHDKPELLAFGKIALITLAQLLDPHATPKALYSLPEGYPHNPQLAISQNILNRPEYILLLKPDSPTIPLPAQFQTTRAHGWTGWSHLCWDHKPVDLCRYCKNSTDGHLNTECPEMAKRRDAGKLNKFKYRLTKY